MCHLDSILLWEDAKDGNSVNGEVVSFYSTFKGAPKCLSEFIDNNNNTRIFIVPYSRAPRRFTINCLKQ